MFHAKVARSQRAKFRKAFQQKVPNQVAVPESWELRFQAAPIPHPWKQKVQKFLGLSAVWIPLLCAWNEKQNISRSDGLLVLFFAIPGTAALRLEVDFKIF